MYKIFRLLMSPADDTGGAGGGTSGTTGGSLFTAPVSGSQASSGTGDAGTASGTTTNQPAGDPSANNTTQGPTATDWRSQLPKELQEDATLKKFTSLPALAASYLNAQKLIGADKIAIPGKNSTDEDWTNAYRKLGLPESVDKYEIKFKDQATVDADFAKQFKETAYKAGVLPKQAQALAEWFSDVNLQSEAKYAEQMQKQFEANKATLQKEWGNSFATNVGRANKVLDELASEDKAYFDSIGLGGNDKFMRFLAKVGEVMYKEDEVIGEDGGVGVMSPKELEMEIGKLRMDPAYANKDHPNHKQVVNEVQSLYQKRYPAKSQ